VWELIEAGGWLMVPIVVCSLLALAIIGERIWTLQRARVVPPGLVNEVREALRAGRLNSEALQALRLHSPLGRVLATGIAHRHRSRAAMLDGIEDAGRHEAHVLERYLNTLGTIAAITPLLGLLGTVIGMIKVFAAITAAGLGDPATMAGGISEALITTAAGLTVAIPSLIAYRYFRGQVDQLIVDMEQESLRLVDTLALNPLNAGDEQPPAAGRQP
jgi:biopolymer transport protein ExbB